MQDERNKVEFQCIPYQTISHYSVESNGSFDSDSEMNLVLCTPWLPCIAKDFRIGNVNALDVENILAAKILVSQAKSFNVVDLKNELYVDPGILPKLFAYVFDNI